MKNTVKVNSITKGKLSIQKCFFLHSKFDLMFENAVLIQIISNLNCLTQACTFCYIEFILPIQTSLVACNIYIPTFTVALTFHGV